MSRPTVAVLRVARATVLDDVERLCELAGLGEVALRIPSGDPAERSDRARSSEVAAGGGG